MNRIEIHIDLHSLQASSNGRCARELLSKEPEGPDREDVLVAAVGDRAGGIEYTRDVLLLPVAVGQLAPHEELHAALQRCAVRVLGKEQRQKRPRRTDYLRVLVLLVLPRGARLEGLAPAAVRLLLREHKLARTLQ